MAKIFASDGTANHQLKKVFISDGTVNHPIKRLFESDGTAWRKIFSSAIRWVYSVSYTLGVMIPTVSPSTNTYPINFTLYANSNTDKYGEVVFTFEEPVSLPTSNALQYIFASTYTGSHSLKIYINGVIALTLTNPASNNLSISSPTSVTEVKVTYSTTRQIACGNSVSITLNPTDRAPFKLSSDGTSEL